LCWPKKIDKLKTIDVPEYFQKPKLLKDLLGFNFIPAKKLSLDGFKQTNSNNFYLEADGNGIEIVKDKELAKLIVSKKWYHQIEDPKKRLVVTKVKSIIPELHKGHLKHF
jgi:catechol-2,3-dioxygenase